MIGICCLFYATNIGLSVFAFLRGNLTRLILVLISGDNLSLYLRGKHTKVKIEIDTALNIIVDDFPCWRSQCFQDTDSEAPGVSRQKGRITQTVGASGECRTANCFGLESIWLSSYCVCCVVVSVAHKVLINFLQFSCSLSMNGLLIDSNL